MEHVVAHVSRAEKFLKSYTRYAYYYAFVERLYAYIIPQNLRILHIGCADGFILRASKPAFAIGIDESSFAPIFNVPNSTFSDSLERVSEEQAFDYIIVSANWLKHAHDIQDLFKDIQRFCNAETRIIIEYSYSLIPITPHDIKHFCALAGFDMVVEKREMLISTGVPMLADLLNYVIARLPIISQLCLMRLFIMRSVSELKPKEYSVSVIIPCKNEAGNIEGAIARTPHMGSFTELLLIDGHSKDSTTSVMQEMVTKYPDKKITWFVQSAKGKKNAVEEGFARAQGDIIMILDGDITVIPEELPKFYEALASGKGECINGSRLVYPMDSQAMKMINWFVNWTFGFILSYLIGQRVKDTLCGTKVFFRKDLKIIASSKAFFGDVDPFGDFDILCGAAYNNLKILDMPVHYKSRTYGAPGIAFFKSGLQLLYMSLMVFKKLCLRR
jgi:SAM-dependent methyltransferase